VLAHIRHTAWGPFAVLSVPVAFGLRVLWPETLPADNLNDTGVHFALVRWARQQIDLGHVPLDGWYPYLGLGSAEFHHYQTFPHIATAYLSLLTGTTAAFFWSQYLLLALWPISVFIGARLFDLGPWAAAVAAVLAPLLYSTPNFGFEHQAYVWQGYGLWTQLWGMALMPVALGLAWRALAQRGSLALAALVLGLTIASHFFVGYACLLLLGVLVIASPRRLFSRGLRAALVGGAALAVASWEIVPLYTDLRWLQQSEYNAGTFYADSFGPGQATQWLFSGELYDKGRLPFITVLVAIGLVRCVLRFRREPAGRAIAGIWLASLLLFFGRGSLDSVTHLLPLGGGILHRYIISIHLSGLLLAGTGVAWIAEGGLSLRRRFAARLPAPALAIAMVVAGLVGLWPAWTQIGAYDARDSEYKAAQNTAVASDGADYDQLLELVRQRGDGRVYSGTRANWGKDYRIGFVPASETLLNRDMDAVGFTLRVSSMLQDTEARFDEFNASHYDLFNVRYLVLPEGRNPPAGATRLATRGRHVLWQMPSTGYFEVVDSIGPPIPANAETIGRQTAGFLESADLAARRFPTVSYDDAGGAEPTLPSGAHPTGPAGSVQGEQTDLPEGIFGAQVTANRPAVVLLKASFDPRFEATLDGGAVTPYMVAPGMVGVTVPPGRHAVEIHYRVYPSYALLITAGAVAVLALAVGPLVWRGLRGRTAADARRNRS